MIVRWISCDHLKLVTDTVVKTTHTTLNSHQLPSLHTHTHTYTHTHTQDCACDVCIPNAYI